MAKYIRYDNYFVIKKGRKYYTTTINKVSEWKEMNKKQKERCINKDVTSDVKSLIRRHGSSKNIHLRTKSKKRVKTIKKKKTNKKNKQKGGK